MSSIDTRVVEMKFLNKDFESGAKETLSTLDKLKNALKLDGARKGIDDVNAAAKGFSLANIAESVETVKNRFSVLGAIGFTAIQNLTNSAMGFGKKVVGMITQPIWQGGLTRSLNMEQARFQFKGLGMDVEAAMKSSLDAVKGTAFGLDEAAVVAAQFGATGMQAGEEMTAALRGISGVAAMAGASYSDIGNVFTKVAGQGRLMGDDLNRLATRGINAAATIAEQMGKTEAEVRAMVTKGQISFQDFAEAMSEAFGEHATKANETYSGSLSNLRAAFARIGADIHTPKLEAMRKVFNALTPAVDNVHAALKPFLRVLAGAMDATSASLVKFLGNFNQEGQKFRKLSTIMVTGFTSLRRVAGALFEIIKPIGQAFRDIFPGPTIEDIRKVGLFFNNLALAMRPSAETAEKLRRVFAGVFAVFGIGWEILKLVAIHLGRIFGAIFEGSGSLLDAAAKVGDFFVKLHEGAKSGDLLVQVFDAISNAIIWVIRTLKTFGSNLADAFSKLDMFTNWEAPHLSEVFSDLYNSASPLSKIGDLIAAAWGKVLSVLKTIGGAFGAVGVIIGNMFKDLGKNLLDIIKNLDLNFILNLLQTGLFASLVKSIKGFLESFGEAGEESQGIVATIKDAVGGLTDTFDEMQNTLKAATLLQIAVAIGVITAAVVALSKIDAADLTKSLTAISVMFAQLFGSMALFQKVSDPKSMAGMMQVTGSMILLAIALNILASAVEKLSDLEWDELARGLTGVVVLLGALAGSTQLMSKDAAGMIRTGASLILLAIAIKILASAVKDIAQLDWGEMARGLVGVGTLLGALAIFTKLVAANKGGLLQSAGLVLLAAAIKILASAATDFAALSWEEIAKGLVSIGLILAGLAGFSAAAGGTKKMASIGVGMVLIAGAMKILAGALQEFATMSWEEIAKGLVTLGGSLFIIAGAMHVMQSAIPGAVAMLIIAPALLILGQALKQMGNLSWEQIAKGMVTLAGSLIIIAAAMYAMTGALPGAAALLIVAASLKLLAPVLLTFSKMSWGEIAKGLLMLAGVFAVIGVAGLLLTPLIPTLLGLGAAIALLGVGMLAAGAGLMLFSTGLAALAVSGAAGAAALVSIVAALLGIIPLIIQQLGMIITGLANAVAEAAPAIIEAFVVLVKAFLEAIVELTPEILNAVVVLLMGILEVLNVMTQPIVDTLVRILKALIEAIVELSPVIVDAVVSIFKDILEGIRDISGDIVDTVVDILKDIVDGIVEISGYIVDGFVQIFKDILAGIEETVPLIVRTILNMINTILDDLAAAVPEMVDSGMRLIKGVLQGIADNIGGVVDEATNIITNFIDAISDNLPKIIQSGVDLVISFVNGVADGIRNNTDAMNEAGANLASAIISGMTSGLSNGASLVATAARSVASSALSAAKSFLGIRSPSKEFEKIGKFVNEGFTKGLRGNQDQVAKAFDDMEQRLISLQETAKRNVDSARDKLNRLTSARKKDNAAIAKAREELNRANKELSLSKAAYTELTKAQAANYKQLDANAKKRDEVIEKLQEEQRVLEAAIKTRDDYNKSVKDQYSGLTDISGEDKTFKSYIDEMSKKILDTKAFSDVVQQLRKLGIDDTLYKELIAKGPTALPFAQSLLESGKEGIEAANDLNRQLTKVSEGLASTASKELYQAAVDSAEGLVKGLQKQHDAITKEMDKIADAMVNSIKKKLGIKSPSKAFEQVGKHSNQGLAKGLKKYSDVVTDASEEVGNDALKSLRKTLSGLSDIVDADMDLTPRIMPVLDLSDISESSKNLGSLFGRVPIAATASYSKAQIALAAYQARQMDVDRLREFQEEGRTIFNQYNTSPKALDRVEIYRQTKNQLSVARGALDR